MAKDFLKALEDNDFDAVLSMLESAMAPPPIGEPTTLSEMQRKRGASGAAAMPDASPVNLAALLGSFGVPAGAGFIDPNAIMPTAKNFIPPHSGPVVQWLGGAMKDYSGIDNLLAGLSAFNNIATTLDLQKRQKKQAEMMANLTPEQAMQLMTLSLIMGGLGSGQ